MEIRQIEEAIHEAIDNGEESAVSAYAEHCAKELCGLFEAQCVAIILADYKAWVSVMAVAAQKAPALADALEQIERGIDRQRATFIEKHAQKISDQREHEAQCRAELNIELRRAS